MTPFATIENVETMWRKLEQDEVARATALLDVISNALRLEARKVGKDLDKMVASDEVYASVACSVTVDVIARTLMTSTNQEPMTQMTQSALGYSYSGSYLVPGGGMFIKNSELSRLGLKRQRYGVIDFYAEDTRDHDHIN
ncbi:phage Gp19/Gp15/Gp42 family protein [Latilactobacillus curvatus]|uniref:phage Gp19/Gp15/Gp42 family protein n=1 Tax=Latilactobacillus curvatus TaxID=28038 RepID=UPI00240FBAEC|nr:phage Gp19/Gp15/Gp42 family protein [Latilactobacillus curvatus]MDG2980304.1 phage Gp19/Gp15/Gp42 family protein [Latilactobacillus curvatus]WCZ54959.1 putative head-to-tail adaptor [Latilactobacillus phage TMW 1.1365 P1]